MAKTTATKRISLEDKQAQMRAKMESLLKRDDVRKMANLIGKFESNGDYHKLVGGKKMQDFAVHPHEKGFKIYLKTKAGTVPTTASGKYQINKATWIDAQKALGITDFSPHNQDLAFAYLLSITHRKGEKRTMLDALNAGNVEEAIRIAGDSHRFASMPTHGQSHINMNTALAAYNNAANKIYHPGDKEYSVKGGGTIWNGEKSASSKLASNLPTKEEFLKNYEAQQQQDYQSNLQDLWANNGLVDPMAQQSALDSNLAAMGNPMLHQAMNQIGLSDPMANIDPMQTPQATEQLAGPSATDQLRQAYPFTEDDIIMSADGVDEMGFDPLLGHALKSGYSNEKRRAVSAFMGDSIPSDELFANEQINKNINGIVNSLWKTA